MVMLISVEPSVTIKLLTNQRVKNWAGVVPEVTCLSAGLEILRPAGDERLIVFQRRRMREPVSAASRKSPTWASARSRAAQTSGKQTRKVTAHENRIEIRGAA